MELRHLGFGNVVSLFGKSVPLRYPAVAQVDAYWEGLRDGRLMPDRSEIDPRGLSDALEFAFVLERVAPGIGRIRISGMHLGDLLGMEVRGMPLTAFFLPESRERIQAALESVVATPQVADISLIGQPGIGKPSLAARMYLAPLSNADGRGAPRILGCLQSHGDIGRAPRRFSIGQVHMRRIVATASSAEGSDGRRPSPAPDAPASGFAERPAPFNGPAGRTRLRVVKSET